MGGHRVSSNLLKPGLAAQTKAVCSRRQLSFSLPAQLPLHIGQLLELRPHKRMPRLTRQQYGDPLFFLLITCTP